MGKRYEKAEIQVWIPPIGFEKTDADKGAKGMLERVPFTPDVISTFIYSMDVILQHEGMDKEVVLPPDMCSYSGSKRNGFRERQEWTNYDLRQLVKNLSAEGTEVYLNVMGNCNNNEFHDEWIYKHPEIFFDDIESKGAINVLRRFEDGSYFEDFFVEKLCQTLVDYDFAGFLPTDLICPMSWRINRGDFSGDMLDQFAQHTGIKLSENLNAGLNDDCNDNKKMRGEWLWNEHRQQWIEFNAWRWGVFWKKVCDAVHAIGKKVMTLGVYCTDPFENYYCLGIDLKILAESGIDAMVPNVVPTGIRLQHPDWHDPYYNYMYMLPLISAFVPQERLITMLGVRDDTEEWDLIHHAPCSLERDIYMMTEYMRRTKDGLKRCTDGFLVCLGDSLRAEDWKWLKDRFDEGLYEGADRAETPTVIWSDNAFYNLVPEYIKTKRWTTHKYLYELGNRGTLVNTVAEVEDLDFVIGNIFVPNFDLFSEDEKKRISSYDRGSVVCTAMKGFDPGAYGIEPDISFCDNFSSYSAMAFAFNTKISDKTKAEIEKLISVDDGKPDVNAGEIVDSDCYILKETLKFTKVTEGFANAVALLVKNTGTELFTSSLPIMVMKLKSGKYRICVLNPSYTSYGYGVVSSKKPYKSVKSVSEFPLLPVKFLTSDDGETYRQVPFDGTQHSFRAKVTPGGMCIFEVEL
ncbi:MAG: hypothetical protein IKT39_02345 [Clostridia bacterium]|nr:hypothetical protein [Clostridia bacterium]